MPNMGCKTTCFICLLCSINYATDDSNCTPFINVASGAECGPYRDMDMSINARRRTVKVDGQ
jgi:hypothetical protein